MAPTHAKWLHIVQRLPNCINWSNLNWIGQIRSKSIFVMQTRFMAVKIVPIGFNKAKAISTVQSPVLYCSISSSPFPIGLNSEEWLNYHNQYEKFVHLI